MLEPKRNSRKLLRNGQSVTKQQMTRERDRAPRKRTADGCHTARLISRLEHSDVGVGRNGDYASPRGRARPSRGWRRC